MSAPSTAVSLRDRTSIRVGGWSRKFHAPAAVEDLVDVVQRIAVRGDRPFILGGGTNTLFPDGEFSRPVVSTQRLDRVDVLGTSIRAECGSRLSALLHEAMSRGLSGIEGLIGIPGSVGGATIMNAGGRHGSIGDRVEELGLLSPDGSRIERRRGADVRWDYRTSHLGGWTVLWVVVGLEHVGREIVRLRASEWMLEKRDTQPFGQPSAGCIFRNPPGAIAAKLIDSLGLKGLTRGGAKVSERHANFIVNPTSSARASDVVSLLEDVRARVARSTGVRLETEIVLA
jgi:UDP-N-acetylmuramate dehydrogenase